MSAYVYLQNGDYDLIICKDLEVKKYVDFMDTNYKKEFTYQEFAHEFTAELFNATQWALLFKDSGAKY